ncbi:MAG: DUF4838 domain-containing protein, partial [Phycisphaerae bacterium]|nr:DUF4838 domain-containing protein [Phycisphaerae bacterium]
MDIVRDGKPCTAIVISDKALPIVQFAAEELRYHIEKAAGAKLEIYPESKKPTNIKGLILVGNCEATQNAGLTDKKLPTNAYMIRCIGDNMFFYGDDSADGALSPAAHIGTISAVYEFLETKLGVRWLWPGPLGEYIPKCKDISVNDWNKDYRQRFTSYWPEPRLKWDSPGAWSSQENKDRFNTQSWIWLRRQRANRAQRIDAAEPFRDWWKRFGKTHPEYFALLPNGKREPLPDDTEGVRPSMCVSNPAIYKQLIQDVQSKRRYWDGVYGMDCISVSENDTPGMCTCEKCRAWDAPDPRFEKHDYWKTNGVLITDPTKGNIRYQAILPDSKGRPSPSLSDRYCKYYLAVLKEARKINPDVVVTGYAYSNWADPP